jgi:hypothetical protein
MNVQLIAFERLQINSRMAIIYPIFLIAYVAFFQGQKDQGQLLSNSLAFLRSNIRQFADHTLMNPPFGCFHLSNGVNNLSDFGHF